MKYCPMCSHTLNFQIPNDDNRHRYICSRCQYIHYENPKIIVGILPYYQNQILLCQRAIDPGYGLWTIPSGFMECNESIHDGAKREAVEEAGIHCQNLQLFVIYSISHISQVYMLFISELDSDKTDPGSETLATKFFSFKDIPWDDIAFSSVEFSLKKFIDHYPIQKDCYFIK